MSGDFTGLTPPNLTMEEWERLEDYKPFGTEQQTLVVARASDIKPKKVCWLWQERLPRGKCVLVAGEGGLGKSGTRVDCREGEPRWRVAMRRGSFTSWLGHHSECRG